MADFTREQYKAFHRSRHLMLLELLARHAPPQVTRALDAGGGGDSAGIAPILREGFGGEVHAVDLGADVEAGRRQGILAVECNIDTQPLPYPAAYFDLVLFASVIEHLYNPAFALAELARVTRPGGVLVVEAPNAAALGRRIDALAGRNPFEWFNLYNAARNKAPMDHCSVFYTREEVEALLAPAFTVLEHRYCMHNPSAGAAKRLVRAAVFALRRRLGDCFFIVAQRVEAQPSPTQNR